MDDIILLEGAALDALLDIARNTDNPRDYPYRLRIAVDAGQLKVKVNERTWSPPLGTVKTGEDAR